MVYQIDLYCLPFFNIDFQGCLFSLNPKSVSSLDLTNEQYSKWQSYLCWNTISTKKLQLSTIYKFANLLNWNILISNSPKININTLVKCSEYVYSVAHLFNDNKIKERYYCDEFYDAFNSLIDWDWAVINKKLSSHIIERYWDILPKYNLNIYQHIDFDIIEKNTKTICWQTLHNQKISDAFIAKYHNNFDIEHLVKYKQLPVAILQLYVHRCAIARNIAKYQQLTYDFIYKNKNMLSGKLISRYQKLSYIQILDLGSYLVMDELAHNKNISTHIINLCGKWYIFDPMDDAINFLDVINLRSDLL